ncbi:type II secretion system F family protein [Labedella populi]|uniref:type II secretion system F family protein n=1 Tax=Labedella populi TaxID=2498850 RepID=UPI001407F29C|nr:type II secretion system F family protein [Labedella populi]
MSRRRLGDAVEDAAGVAERLAVLLGAGVAPASVWGYLIDDSAVGSARGDPLGDRLRLIDAAARTGRDVAPAIVGALSDAHGEDAWRAVAAAWIVSSESGAPMGPALRAFSTALRAIVHSRREVDVALAGPLLSSRIVLALPLVAIGLGAALGFDVLGVLFGSITGFVCLVVGATLAGVAVWWVARLTAAARRADPSPGLNADLVAIAMGGGVSAERAVALVEEALALVDLPGGASTAVDGILAVSRRAGVPAGELLRSEAESERRRARTEGARRAARLGSLLMLPLGVCVLPAFIVLGIVPMVLSLLSSTGLAW